MSPHEDLFDDQIEQFSLFDQTLRTDFLRSVGDAIVSALQANRMPGPGELVEELTRELGWRAGMYLQEAVRELRRRSKLSQSERGYLDTVLTDEAIGWAIESARRGDPKAGQEHRSTIDELLRRGSIYRHSVAFKEMMEFNACFREYSPFNNMLVRVQNPACSYYARESDWMKHFGCRLRPEARPMLILAPMHPVMTVFDLDSVENPPIPEHLRRWTASYGEWDPERLERTIANAARDEIIVSFRALSTTLSGFARHARRTDSWKMDVVVHEGLSPRSRYAVLCHELAHIYLGHLGNDEDGWWPCRTKLTHRAVEIEAESAAFIATARAGLATESERYLASFSVDGRIPDCVSVELVTKVAGRLVDMATRSMPRRTRKVGVVGGRGQLVDGTSTDETPSGSSSGLPKKKKRKHKKAAGPRRTGVTTPA